MKYYLFIFIVTQISYSQSFQVFDLETKNSIPYASVFIDTIGFYTNGYGKFTINSSNYDSIYIDHLNYHKLKLQKLNTSDSIFLKPKTEILNTVNLYDFSQDKQRRLRVPRKFFSAIITRHSELITCYNPKKNISVESLITKLKFKLSDSKFHIDINEIKQQKVTLRLNVYENKDQHPDEPLFSYEPKTFLLKNVIENNFFFEFDIKDRPITITENGFCLGLEHLKFSDYEEQDGQIKLFFDSHMNKSKFFENTTYLYYPLRNNDKIISNKNFHDVFFKEMNIKNKAPVFIAEIQIYE